MYQVSRSNTLKWILRLQLIVCPFCLCSSLMFGVLVHRRHLLVSMSDEAAYRKHDSRSFF
jgi:hypothetical protein